MGNIVEDKLVKYQAIFETLKMPVFPGRDEQFMLDYKSIPERANADEKTENCKRES